jgi:hypothetical protein
MDRKRNYLYGAVVVAVGAAAVWAGMPPVLLVFLLVCPLMMFAMHGGGHGAGRGREQGGGAGAQDEHGQVSGNVKHK